ncbi:related to 4-coumarate-CoA ligase [Phialocephala subalpina]|uniref:Related to 4-coumarate-CoA ligase n=1 Tax=Phialocephala subalpina TaxID=576137 RepID=A0A1L7XKR4_9HELO|nr:related to 4-coumarate-CoA ligase [Phialocephala subalpina]
MPREIPRIEIPHTDLWAVLFDRKEKPFPDSQVIYQCPYTNRKYTFSKLREATIKFGSGLRAKWDWKKGDVLAIFSQNCIDTPAITWGTHWAGGVVSPANPGYGVRELGHHLRDSGTKALFTQKHLLPVATKACSEVGIPHNRIVLIGDERDSSFLHFTDLQDPSPGGEREKLIPEKDLAFLVYSSGTTGLPKGVMLSHLNVVSDLFMVDSNEGTILGWEGDRVLSVLPYYHIYGLQCLVHWPAYAGLTTLVMPSFDLKKFCEIIQNHKITYTFVAPPVVLHLAKSPIVSNYNLSSLRMITSGAAPLTKELIHAVHDRLGTEVKQAYGLSETSPVTHMQRKWDKGLGSNGPALPNQICKFMSPDGHEVAPGKEGELWISGPNVFLGYHNNEEATKACKTEDGFFKTGDIGYEDEEGNMYITDRVKELIKYKGFQVAPAELEGILASHELVADVAVIGVEDKERATEVPLACIVLKEGVMGEESVEKEIVWWLGERVAGHKRLRGGVVWVEEVPKSAPSCASGIGGHIG